MQGQLIDPPLVFAKLEKKKKQIEFPHSILPKSSLNQVSLLQGEGAHGAAPRGAVRRRVQAEQSAGPGEPIRARQQVT